MLTYHTRIFDIRISKAEEIDLWLSNFKQNKPRSEYNYELKASHILQGNCVLLIVEVFEAILI